VYTKRLIFISVANAENSGSYIDNILLEPNFYNFALNLPKVLMNVFIKPFPTDARSIPELMYSLENVFFLILSFYALILFFKRKFNFDILKNNNLMIPVLIFGIYLFLIIGYTTPVYGAITRYKCIVLPYYLVFLLSQFNWGLILKKKTR
jgi:hypothetical protein